jgi:hypothetical protein
MDVTYSIISRGEMIICYKNVSIKVTGELVLQPPTFYADLISLENVGLLDEEKGKIIEFIITDSLQKIGTKIIFD